MNFEKSNEIQESDLEKILVPGVEGDVDLRIYKKAWESLSEEDRETISNMPTKEVMVGMDYDDVTRIDKDKVGEEQIVKYREAVARLKAAEKPLRVFEEASRQEKIDKEAKEREADRKAAIRENKESRAEEHSQKRGEKIAGKAAAAGVTPEEYVAQRRQENKETQA